MARRRGSMMDAILAVLARGELLVGAAIAVLLLGLAALIGFGKPYVVTITAHRERVEAEKARADKAEEWARQQVTAANAACAAEIAAAKAEFAERMTRAERTFELVLGEARRYADDWRGTAHITAENANKSEERLDEVLESVRLMVGILTAAQNHQRPKQRQLPTGQRSDRP